MKLCILRHSEIHKTSKTRDEYPIEINGSYKCLILADWHLQYLCSVYVQNPSSYFNSKYLSEVGPIIKDGLKLADDGFPKLTQRVHGRNELWAEDFTSMLTTITLCQAYNEQEFLFDYSYTSRIWQSDFVFHESLYPRKSFWSLRCYWAWVLLFICNRWKWRTFKKMNVHKDLARAIRHRDVPAYVHIKLSLSLNHLLPSVSHL